jgi:RND family efflux transporter MFP subunit
MKKMVFYGRRISPGFCILPGLLSLVFFGFGSCTKVKATSGIPVQEIEVLTAAGQSMADEIAGFGALSFLTKVDITASQEGTIFRLNRREGDMVREGELIGTLRNPQVDIAVGKARNAYTQAEAALRLANARLLEGRFNAESELLNIAKTQAELVQARRAYAEEQRKQGAEEKLFEAGGVSEEEIRGSRFKLENAEEQIRLMEQDLEIRTVGLRDRDLAAAGLLPPGGFPDEVSRTNALIDLAVSTLRAEEEAARAQLEAAAREMDSILLFQSELTLRSPASGTVGARYLEVGERAASGDKILTLIDTEALYAIISLRESDALRLERGMAARVLVDSTGETYEGTVELVAPQADSQSFTFTVRVLLKDTGQKLKPGMFARVVISAGPEKHCIAVPEKAIARRTGDGGTVFVVSGDVLSERKVVTGRELENGERELLSGLAAGEVIAARAGAALREGMRVKITQGGI